MITTNSRKRLLLLLVIIFLAFALRMARIGELHMWGDEAYSVFSAHRTLAAITFEGAENDPHPPLYYYLLHFYMPAAGASELALRFFSVFPGLLTVALLYAIGKRLFNPQAGLAASAVAAIAPFAVYYSQEIRMYALAIFLTTLALYFFVRLLNGNETRRLWLAYALAMFLALFSLYQVAFVFLAEGLFLLTLFGKRRAFVLRWFAVSGTVVVLYLPWLAFRFSSTLGHLEDRAGRTIQSFPVFVARGFAALTVGSTLAPTEALALSAVFALVIAAALVLALRVRRANLNDWLLLALVAVPIVAVYPLYLLLPILVARLFALAFAPLALLVGRSLLLLDRRLALPLALAIAAISAYSLNDYIFRFDRYNASAEDYIPLIQAVEKDAKAGDMVLIHADWQLGYFLSHYQGPPIEYGQLPNRADLSRAVAQPRTIWAVVQGFTRLDPADWLVQHSFPLGETQFGQMHLMRFQTGAPSRGERFAEPLLYDNGIALLGYRANGEPLESGRGRATVELDWRATTKIAEDYTISLRLTDEQGEIVWAQDDGPPATGTLPTSEWQPDQTVTDYRVFTIPPGTPPGDYTLRLVMYQSTSKSPANVIAPENWRGQAVPLGNIAVSRPTPPVPVTVPDSLKGQWNEVALAGFESGAKEIMAGGTFPLTLYWQAQSKPALDYAAAVQVIDAAGTVRETATFRPGNPSFPTTAWNAGETWVDKTSLTVDASAAGGDATLTLGLVNAASGQAVGSPVALAHVKINTRQHDFTLPKPQQPLSANFDNKIKLLGYNLASSILRPSESLNLTIYWQSLAPVKDRYSVFVHLLDASGNLVAQRDSEPEEGAAPTTSWLQGEVIADTYVVSLPPALAPGDYVLETGIYLAATGTRLPLADQAGDHLTLTQIRVNQP